MNARTVGSIMVMAIVAGVLPLAVFSSVVRLQINYNYGLVWFGGLGSVAGGIVAVWAAVRHYWLGGSAVAKALASGTGCVAGSALVLSGSFLIVFAMDNIRRPAWCRDPNALAAASGLKDANAGIAALSSINGLPRLGTHSDWDAWVGTDVADALADPNVAYRGAYKFVYTPIGTPPKAYRIEARPVEYGRQGVCSVYTDQSGVIRYTTEDRPATALDPDIAEERWGSFLR